MILVTQPFHTHLPSVMTSTVIASCVLCNVRLLVTAILAASQGGTTAGGSVTAIDMIPSRREAALK
jgi:hypothetical protein